MNGRLDEALMIFETRLLESRNPPPDTASFNIVIDALRKLAQVSNNCPLSNNST